jgi:hypothetical protein
VTRVYKTERSVAEEIIVGNGDRARRMLPKRGQELIFFEGHSRVRDVNNDIATKQEIETSKIVG